MTIEQLRDVVIHTLQHHGIPARDDLVTELVGLADAYAGEEVAASREDGYEVRVDYDPAWPEQPYPAG